MSTPNSPSQQQEPKSPSTMKKSQKDVFSAQILLGMKNLSSPPQSLSAPSSPLPIQAPLSPSMSMMGDAGSASSPAASADILLSKTSPVSPRSSGDRLPVGTTANGNDQLAPHQTVCTFKECLLCKRGSPFVNNQSPTWACIMRIVFYCLQIEMPQKPFLNLKTDVYGFMTAHWHLLCLDKKRSDNWHKQIQDMLSHSKNLFESGMDTYKQNGYWRMKQISDPWDEIKSKKVLTKRKRSYSEADKDHSMKNTNNSTSTTATTATATAAATATPIATTTTLTVPSPSNFIPSLASPSTTTTSASSSSFDKRIHEQISSHIKSMSSQSLTSPVPSPRGNSPTQRLKKRSRGDSMLGGSKTTLPVTTSSPPSSVPVAPIPTIPMISMLMSNDYSSSSSSSCSEDESSLSIDEREDVNIEEIEEIKSYEDDTPMGLLMLSSSSSPLHYTSSASSAAVATTTATTANNNNKKKGFHLPLSSHQSEGKGESSHGSGVAYLPSSALLPNPITVTTTNTAAKEEDPTLEEVQRLRTQLRQIYDNLSSMVSSHDHSSIKPMLEKEINRINILNHFQPTESSPLSSLILSQKIAAKSATTESNTSTTNNVVATSPSSTAVTHSTIEDNSCVPSFQGLSALSMAATNI
ncbi:hypothetical protein DFA_09030 [Cavenderia fasciculata]|uniref:Uncharacterized protein n=1 Tax=Cavenderia fasciculata TaxID=261658 RepID=F4Q6I2_CACFS|nr:uncharacterized protein DFA_09030 [Cavenderia fasciculata]EGG16492.1 hypothetical protein DFA_09030 [Cavenderia fasciculata]|eukprot:XP_004354892.1 hypothetical protein DFA_09030 [Cavenderia fasciculata]